MHQGRPFRHALAAVFSAVCAVLVLACGSTSVTEVSGPTDVRCQTTLSASPQSVGPDGGGVTITVATTRDCAWTTGSDASWIRLSTATGQGEATITANVDANPQITSRSGTVSVNAQRTSIVQAGRPCTFALAAAGAQFEAAGGSGRLSVTTLAGCAWRATTTAGWIQVGSTAMMGSGTIAFQVAANDGADRTAVITVADQQFVVTQSAAPAGPPPTPEPPPPPPGPTCMPTVTPLTIDTAAAASTQTIRLITGAACSWSATSSAAWLTLVSPPSGTGNATITVAVAANSGAARSGTISVAGQVVTVRQAALSCSFALSPSAQDFPAAGGSGHFTVTTQAGCAWSASKSAPWIALASSSGVGTGDITFTVQPNTATTARSETIMVSGQAFTVTEAAAACSYTLVPTSLNIGVDGGHGRFGVTTSANCSWTAVAGAQWVDVANQSGTGPGDVNFNVQANPTTAARSTTITVGGQTVTLTQAGLACTFTLNPTSTNIVAAGANGQFTVTTQAGCTWTAVPGAAWVTINAPAAGNGTGTADVAYTVQPNADPTLRSTTVTVAGQAFTINQAAAPAPCTYALNPASGSFPSAGGSDKFAVTTQDGCSWTARTMDAWITLTVTSGTGAGDVTYAVQANATGAARSGTITVGGQTYGVTQSP